MKNVFGINLTKGEDSKNLDGHGFIVRKLDNLSQEILDHSCEQSQSFEQKSKLPLAFTILLWATGGIGIFLFSIILGTDTEIKQAYNNAPYLFWIAGGCIVAWLALLIWSKLRNNSVVKSDEFKEHLEKVEQVSDNTKERLDIPKDAYKIDVLMEGYVIKNGKQKKKNMGLFEYVNFEAYAFIENDTLCLADLEQVIAIPLASFRSMSLCKKRTTFPFWNKPQKFNAEPYKKYKITANGYGMISKYYRIEISDNSGEFYMLIPVYEGETFTKLTGLCESAEIEKQKTE